MSKTVRFSDLVRASGRPQFITLWTAPENDPRVNSAMRENRVLTVFEEPGQKPRGQLGLHPGPHSMFLVFPRPLTLEPQTRVVGINYALAEQPEVKDPVVVPEPDRQAKQLRKAKHKPLVEAEPKPAPRPHKPVKKTFTVRLRRTAILEETREVEAESRAEAEQQALEQAQTEVFELNKAEVSQQIVK